MEEFEIWKKIFNGFLKDELYRLREIVSPLNLSIKIVAGYQFRSRWYAAYLHSRGEIRNGVIEVAINYPFLFKAMKRQGIAQDEFNIEAQARISLGHEVAHGVIDYLRTLEPRSLSKSLRMIRRCGRKQEEEYAEEFGESRFPEATGIFSSVVESAIDEMSEMSEMSETNIPLNESRAVRMWYYTQNKQKEISKEMKRSIRLNEENLYGIIQESLSKIMNEQDFREVDNLDDYIKSNGLQMKPASKFQRVNAQSGKNYINQYGRANGLDKRQIGRMVRRGGAPLTTIAGDGTKETQNLVTRNHTVLNNVGNTDNKWAVENPTFKRKYEMDAANRGVYKPKGGPMNAAQINEPISFTAPWGEKMNIDKGGYILQDPNNPNDAYGISGKDFDATYRFDESRLNHIISESIRKVLNHR